MVCFKVNTADIVATVYGTRKVTITFSQSKGLIFPKTIFSPWFIRAKTIPTINAIFKERNTTSFLRARGHSSENLFIINISYPIILFLFVWILKQNKLYNVITVDPIVFPASKALWASIIVSNLNVCPIFIFKWFDKTFSKSTLDIS